MARVAQVQNQIKLIVIGIGGVEVGRAGGYVGEFAVDEPDAVDAARIWAGRIEERKFEILQALRVLDSFEIRHIQHPQTGHFLAYLQGLIGHY